MYWSWERGTKILYNCSTFSINIEKSATDGESQPVWLLPLLLPKYKHTGVAHQCTAITTKVLRCPTVCSSHPLRLVLYYTNQQQFIYNKQILDVIAVFSLLFLLLRTYVVVALAIWWRRLMWQWRTLCVFILSFRSFFAKQSLLKHAYLWIEATARMSKEKKNTWYTWRFGNDLLHRFFSLYEDLLFCVYIALSIAC